MIQIHLLIILKVVKCEECLEFGSHCINCENGSCIECQQSYGIDTNRQSENYGKCRKCEQLLCKNCQNDYQKCSERENIVQFSEKNKNSISEKCDFPCQTCDSMDITICYSCMFGHGLSNSRCVKCNIDNCYDCSSGINLCKECRPGYGLDSNGKCQKCEDGCALCYKNNKICEECKNKYGFDNEQGSITYGKCISCHDSNCFNCNEDASKCNIYSGSYYMDEDSSSITYGKLVSCSPHCNYCFKNDICESCNFNRRYGMNNGKCSKCLDPNCNICQDDYSICVSCMIGFSMDRDPSSSTFGKCITCKENCVKCSGNDASYCYSCHPGFGTDDGKCVNCQDEHCAICREKDYCTLCEDGYVSIDSTHSCVKSELKNCIISNSNADSCIKCKENSQLVDSQCIDYNLYPHCKSYILKNNIIICDECEEGYGFNLVDTKDFNNSCERCIDENCENCTLNISNCVSCKTPYYLNITSNKCVLNCTANNCNICHNNNNTKCFKCEDGYGFNRSGECEKCPPHCRLCHESIEECDECYKGYYLYYTKCIECNIPNCENCFDPNECGNCKEGFYRENNKCLKCKVTGCRCFSSEAVICDSCISGYGLDHRKGTPNYNLCVPCSVENCKKCDRDPTVCTLCTNGDEPKDDNCPYFSDDKIQYDEESGSEESYDEETDSSIESNPSFIDEIHSSYEDKNIENENSNSKKKVPVAAIVVPIVVGVAVIGVIGAIIYFNKKKIKVSASP